jgi:flagellar motor switch protein FliG
MNEFMANFNDANHNLCVSGKDFLEKVIEKTLDKDTATEVFKVINAHGSGTPFSDLAYVSADNLFNAIHGEHPQTIALILSYFPYEKAAEILCLFREDLRAEIAYRIVKIGQVDADILRELDETIKKDLAKINVSAKKINGVETVSNILNMVDGSTEETVLAYIEEHDSDLATKVKQNMFVFEDLLATDNLQFRVVLQNIDNQLLLKALKTSSEEMKEKVFSNLSQRASEMLKDDMEAMGPVRIQEVEEAQQKIIGVAKNLEKEGKIVLGKGKDDVFV